jgi:hypothetical protein
MIENSTFLKEGKENIPGFVLLLWNGFFITKISKSATN